MISKFERFWIIFVLRFGIGFLLLFAAINILTYGVDKFSDDLSKGFEPTWLGKITLAGITGMDFVKFFLKYMPYVMGALSIPILTGIFAKPALRLAVIVFLCFGLGKYVQNDIATTAADFLFASIICAGLYFWGLEPKGSEGSR